MPAKAEMGSSGDTVRAVDLFFDLKPPVKFSRSRLQGEINTSRSYGGEFSYMKLELNESERDEIKKIVGILEDESTALLIDKGYLTLGMIRPQANESRVPEGMSDEEAVEFLLVKAQEPITVEGQPERKLKSVFVMPIVFTEELVEEFYAGLPKENQLKVNPVRDPGKLRFNNRWEEWKDFMTSGPTTVVLFFLENPSSDVDAVAVWRHKLGRHWKSGMNLPGTIRYEYASLDNHQNLGHGSDSRDAAKREIELFANHLESVI